GDHSDDVPRMGTGRFGVAAPGLLTVLGRFLGDGAPFPVADLGGSGALAAGGGEWTAYAPVALDPLKLPSAVATRGPARLQPLEDALDSGQRQRRHSLAAAALDAYRATKRAMRTYGPVFVRPELQLADPARYGAAVAGITNRMLLEAVGNQL